MKEILCQSYYVIPININLSTDYY